MMVLLRGKWKKGQQEEGRVSVERLKGMDWQKSMIDLYWM